MYWKKVIFHDFYAPLNILSDLERENRKTTKKTARNSLNALINDTWQAERKQMIDMQLK